MSARAVFDRRRQAACLVLVVLLGLAVYLSWSHSASPRRCAVSATLVPSCGAWFGVAPDAWSATPPVKATHRVERAAGRTMAIVHFYHRGGELFPTRQEIALARGHRLLFINWKPGSGHTWAQVARGAADAGIDREAAYLRRHFTVPFFLAIHHEPENEVRPAVGSGYTAEDYRAMFRHVVLRLRADGVHNAVTVMNYMGAAKWLDAPWFDRLYPGDDVVDWVAFDAYSFAAPGWRHTLFARTIDRPGTGFYSWLRRNHPDKPIMLAEWGVYGADGAFKARFFDDMRRHIAEFPKIKAYVYFNAADEPRHGDARITTSAAAQHAFGALARMPYFRYTRVPAGPAGRRHDIASVQ